MDSEERTTGTTGGTTGRVVLRDDGTLELLDADGEGLCLAPTLENLFNSVKGRDDVTHVRFGQGSQEFPIG